MKQYVAPKANLQSARIRTSLLAGSEPVLQSGKRVEMTVNEETVTAAEDSRARQRMPFDM